MAARRAGGRDGASRAFYHLAIRLPGRGAAPGEELISVTYPLATLARAPCRQPVKTCAGWFDNLCVPAPASATPPLLPTWIAKSCKVFTMRAALRAARALFTPASGASTDDEKEIAFQKQKEMLAARKTGKSIQDANKRRQEVAKARERSRPRPCRLAFPCPGKLLAARPSPTAALSTPAPAAVHEAAEGRAA